MTYVVCPFSTTGNEHYVYHPIILVSIIEINVQRNNGTPKSTANQWRIL